MTFTLPRGGETCSTVVVCVSPTGEAQAFCRDLTPNTARSEAERAADVMLLAARGAAPNRRMPSREELVQAIAHIEPGACWITYLDFDHGGNVTMRRERRDRVVPS